jgi:hypothetical protein
MMLHEAYAAPFPFTEFLRVFSVFEKESGELPEVIRSTPFSLSLFQEIQ